MGIGTARAQETQPQCPSAPGEDTRSRNSALVNQEPVSPGFSPDWVLKVETQPRTFQSRRWEASRWVSQGLRRKRTHLGIIWIPRAVVSPLKAVRCAGHILCKETQSCWRVSEAVFSRLSLTGSKPVSQAKRKPSLQSPPPKPLP